MLPRNIDLTEHNDFHSHNNTEMTLANVRRLRNLNIISLDGWDVIQWWESIFGKKSNDNQKECIFSPIKKWERRIPWEAIDYSLYNNNMLYDYDDKYKLFPWYEEPRAVNNRSAKEIFHLR